MKNIFKKTASFILVFALIFSMMPLSFADSTERRDDFKLSKTYSVSKNAKNYDIKLSIKKESDEYNLLAPKTANGYRYAVVYDRVGAKFDFPKGGKLSTNTGMAFYDDRYGVIFWQLGDFDGEATLEYTLELKKSAYEFEENEFGYGIPEAIYTSVFTKFIYSDGYNNIVKDFENPEVAVHKINYYANYPTIDSNIHKTFGYVNGFEIYGMYPDCTNVASIKAPDELGFERAGYVFKGWNTKPDGSGKNIDMIMGIYKDIDLYAQWKEEIDYGVLAIKAQFKGNWEYFLPRSVDVAIFEVDDFESIKREKTFNKLGKFQIQINSYPGDVPRGMIELKVPAGWYLVKELGLENVPDMKIVYDGGIFEEYPNIVSVKNGEKTTLTITNVKTVFQPIIPVIEKEIPKLKINSKLEIEKKVNELKDKRQELIKERVNLLERP